jgi:hypothetical protein
MLKLDEKVFDVTWHTDATAMSGVIPFDVNAGKYVPCHIELHAMELLEYVEKMVEVFVGMLRRKGEKLEIWTVSGLVEGYHIGGFTR